MADKHIIFGCILVFVGVFQGGVCEENPYKNIANLDKQGHYLLEWLVNWETRRVIFNVTVRTTGYIGFGLSIRGRIAGADIVVGGVDPSGQPYFTDYHGRDTALEADTNQDWILHDAWEREATTFLSFSRPFDTCDENDQDLAITDDMLNIIWTFGETDEEIQTFEPRGLFPVYLLDPDIVPRSIDERVPESNKGPPLLSNSIQLFNMTTTQLIPAQDTLYWCKFHKVPTSTKHHIIGFNTAFPTEKDKRHVHHLVLLRCIPPQGVDLDTLFDAESPGHECYFPRNAHPSNSQYCTEYSHLFAVGARPIFFPDHAGMPMSASGSEYFLLQTHYDNPDLEPNLEVTFSLEAYYTSNLRENDAGMMITGVVSPGAISVIIPPNSTNHTIRGHCAPGCSEQIFPEEGINVFASYLHTHISGVAAKYQHFRGNRGNSLGF